MGESVANYGKGELSIARGWKCSSRSRGWCNLVGGLSETGLVVSARCEIKPRVAWFFNLLPSRKQISSRRKRVLEKTNFIVYSIVDGVDLVS